MKQRNYNSSLLKLVLIGLLIFASNCIVGSQYLSNPRFTDSVCTPTDATPCTMGAYNQIANWEIYRNSDKTTTATTKIETAGSLITAPNPASNSVWLQKTAVLTPGPSSISEALCAKTSISNVPAGAYTFSTSVFAPLVANGAQQTSTGEIFIEDDSKPVSGGGSKIYNFTLIWSNAVYELIAPSAVNFLKFYGKINIWVCNTNANQYGIYVKDFSFKRNGDTCNPPVDSSQPTNTGSQMCVVHATVRDSLNCYAFGTDSSGNVICKSCNPSSTTPYLVPLTGSLYGCAQIQVPGASQYSLSTVANAADSAGLTYLVPTACAPTTGSIKVAIPSFANSKDNTHNACRADLPNVLGWQIVNGAYKIAGCAANYGKITVTGSIQTQGCIDNSANSQIYDAQCVSYSYDPVTPKYTCNACQSGYTLSDVSVNNGANVKQCLDNGAEVIPSCTVYSRVDMTTPYFCKTCAPDATIIPNMGTLAVNGQGCTKLQTFPSDIFKNCTLYTRITLSTTQLTCVTCDVSEAGVGSYCKQVLDYCDNHIPPIPGVAVTVNGISNQCALYGIVNYCLDYTSIDLSTKTLGPCKTCKSVFSPVTSVTGASICLNSTYLVPNCSKYEPLTSECKVCVSGLPYNNVTKLCPSSAAQLIPGCQTAYMANIATPVCSTCMVGYVLDSTAYGSRCIQAISYCSTYSSILPPVCSACISGYILNNNTCTKQSTQCGAVDASGKCIQCIVGFTVVNGICVQSKNCTSSQYVNSLGNCQQGNVTNCQSYNSPNGQCTKCKSGYTFNATLQCVQSSISCPSATSSTKFIILGTACVQTDINCLSVRSDGFCSICGTGYYQLSGKCYAILQTQDNSTQNVQQFTNLLTDQFGYQYMLNSDGSRSYITGPWIGLYVWADQQNNLYIKNSNGSRGYLTGLLQSRVAYKDQNGYWYANNPDGSRLYYTGPYANKSVFVDQSGSFFSLNSDGSRYYLSGIYQGKTVYLDGDGYYYLQNPDGSITYLTGPYKGQTLFKGPGDYLYSKNPDGSRSYVNGPWVGSTVYVDQQGRLYTKDGKTSITFLSGPYTGQTAYFDQSGYIYITNPDGSRTYLNGPYAPKGLIYIDGAGFYYYINPDGSRTYLTGPYANQIVFTDNTGYLYQVTVPGTRTYISGPYVGYTVVTEPGTNYLYYSNPDGSRTYLTGPSAQQTIYPDANGNQYTLNPDGSRYYLTGPNANKTVFSDSQGYLYVKNTDGSITYLSGPSTGKIVFTDNTGSYTVNPNGSRTYLTGPNTGKIVFVDSTGYIYTTNPDGTRTYLSGPNTGSTVYTSPNTNYQYIVNPDGSIKYLTGPNVGKTVLESPDGYQYIKNPDGTITYLTGPNVGQVVYVDPTTKLQYTKNPDGTRKYLADPTTSDVPKPSTQDIITNLVDGNAKIITNGPNSYIVYKDPTGKTYAVLADQTFPDGIIFTDSNGNKYFISNTPGSQPLPLQVDSKGNTYVINPDGTMKNLSTTPTTPTNNTTTPTNNITIPTNNTNTPTNNTTTPTNNATTPTNNNTPSPANPSSPTIFQDVSGYQYQVVDGVKKYLTGPYAGKTILTDTNGDYVLNTDGSKQYTSGPYCGYTVYKDASGNLYYNLPNGARQYISGPNAGKQLYPDQSGNLFTVNPDKTRTYVTGPNVGQTVTTDIDGYIYKINLDGSATYTSGPYAGVTLTKDPQGNYFRLNNDGTKTYVTGPNAGKTTYIDPSGNSYQPNADGSRTYITGPYAGKTYFVDPNGNLYSLTTDNQRIYVTGQNSGNTVYVDNLGNSYKTNPDGSRTYTTGQFTGQTLYADPQQYLYQLNPDGSRKYLSGPMAGKTVFVDPSGGYLYLQNNDGSRTYLTGPLAGRTISNGSGSTSTPVDGTGLTLIYRDDQGTFILDSQGKKKYLSLVSGSSPTQQTYKDSTGANYIIYTDSNGNKYTKNSDGTKNYLTGFTSNPLNTYIVKVDENGVEYSIYSDSIGNRYIVYTDPSNGQKYYLNTDGSKKYLGSSSPLSNINSTLLEPDTIYRLYTDASGNIYVVYVDTEGRYYTILSDKTKKYLEAPAIQTYGFIVFEDNNGDKFVLDADGSRNYLKIDPTALQGPNFVTYIDQNGKYYRIYTDPAGDKYTLNQNGTKSYITSFPLVPGNNYKVYVDALGTQFTVYTVPNGDTYTAYQYTNGDKFYYDINGKQIPIQGTNSGQTTNTGTQPAYNWFGIIFTDDSGNKYVLNSDKTWNYLFLAPGSSPSGNPAIYRDSNSGNYMIYPDSATGNKYVKKSDGTKTYLTGFPTTTYGNPISLTDAYGNIYTIYSDPNGNKYITYSDPKGKYSLTNSGSKVYLPTTVSTSTTPSNGTNIVTPGTNGTNTGTTTGSTTGTGGAGIIYIFTDSTGGNKYILNSTGSRIYLTLSSTSGNTQTYTDPQNNKYTIVRDSTSGNLYTPINGEAKQYLTSFPTTTSGTPITLTDTLGTKYGIYSDLQGNKYITYTDSVGVYYINSNGIKVYLSDSGLIGGGFTYIFTDNTLGTKYILGTNGVRTYLTLSSTSGNTQIYSDPQGNKYTIVKDPTSGNLYTTINGNLKEYLTSFPQTTSGTPISLTDSLGTQYAIYSDSQGNKYVAYTDYIGIYYLNSNGVKIYLSDAQTSGVNGVSPTYIFTDNTGNNKYILGSNGVRTYLTLSSTSGNTQIYSDPQGNKYTIVKDPTSGNLYTTINGNIKQYLTSFPQTTSGTPIPLTDSLGTQYSIYTDLQGNKYVQYYDPSGIYYLNSTGAKVYLPNFSTSGSIVSSQLVFTDSTGGNRYILSNNGVRTYLTLTSTNGNVQTYSDPLNNKYTITRDPASNNIYTVINSGTKEFLTSFPVSVSGAPTTLTDSIGTQYGIYTDLQGNKYVTYTDNVGVYYINSNAIKVYFPSSSPSAPINTGSTPVTIFTDSTGGHKYILSNNGIRIYLTFVSASNNNQVYADPSGNKYTIYKDSATGNLYTLTNNGIKSYLTSLSQTTSGNPTALTDSIGQQYAIYTDAQGNRYVTYSDSIGKYYLNSNGEKIYLNSIVLATPTYVFLDNSGNKYVLSNKGVRVYLHPVSQSGNSQVFADPLGNQYTITTDPQGNLYTTVSGVRQYLTSYPQTVVGQPYTATDSVGVIHNVYSDAQGIKYITYTDSTGKFYYDNNEDPVYLSKSNNLSSDNGQTGALWGLINSLESMLAQCQGAMFA